MKPSRNPLETQQKPSRDPVGTLVGVQRGLIENPVGRGGVWLRLDSTRQEFGFEEIPPQPVFRKSQGGVRVDALFRI